MTRRPFSFNDKIDSRFPKVQGQIYEVENLKVRADGGTTYAIVQPRLPFRLREVYLSPDYDKVNIQYVQVGNVIQAKFSKRCDVCIPGMTITAFLESFEPNEVIVKVIFRGDEAIPE